MENDKPISLQPQPSSEDLQSLLSKANQIQQTSLFQINSFCDFNYENEWHVAFIKSITPEDKYEIEFNYNDKQKSMTVQRNHRLSLLRFHSSQFKNISIRDEPYAESELNAIKETLIKAEADLFSMGNHPYDIIQFCTGQIPEILDILTLTDDTTCTDISFDILLLIVKIITNSIIYANANDNRQMFILALKHRELSLIDKSFAYLLSIEVLVQCLRRIMSTEYKKNIYSRVMHQFDNRRKEMNIPQLCIEPDSNDKKTYCFFIDVLVQWNMIDTTFELIIQSPQIPFDLIEKLIYSFKIVKLFGPINHYEEQFKKLISYYQQRICNLTENELKELKKNGIIDYSKSILVLSIPSNLITNETEKLFYMFLYKCFLSQNLEKRIYAVNAINSIVNNITSKQPSNQNEEEKIFFKSYELLIEFIQQKNIISILLGENAHDELIKRSIGLFKFLAEKDQLSIENYENLWENYTKRHESISMQIENVICEIASVVNEEKLKLLFEKIKAYPQINVKILHFIRKFTQGCYRVNKTIYINQEDDFDKSQHLYGLPLLWWYMQDYYPSNDPNANTNTNSNTPSIENNQSNIKECVDSIHALLMVSSISDSVVHKVLSLCTENISNHLSVIQSIQLIKKICKDRKNQSKLFQEFSDSIKLISLIITDLKRYMKSSDTDFQITYEGFFNHKKNISKRLSLIFFLDEISQYFPLQTEHILALWDIFYSSNRTNKEQSMLFDCLQNKSSSSKVIDNFLFNEILTDESHFNCSTISRDALKLFETVFIEVNKKSKALFYDGKNYRVKSSTIQGIDTLWQILIYNSNQSVQDRVCRLLCDLYIKLYDYSNNFTAQYWSGFIEKLTACLEEASQTNNSRGITGLINLMSKIYSEVENVGIIPQKDDVYSAKSNYELYSFVCPLRNNKKYTVRVGKDENLFEVRWRLAYYYDIEVNKLVFKNKNRYANMFNDFTKFSRIFNYNEQVIVTSDDLPILQLQNPKKLIESNENILIILFSLLHHSDEEYISRAWELIRSLPENNFIQNQVNSLGSNVDKDKDTSVDFNNLIDLNSLYVVTYSLQLINKYIVDNGWLMNFIMNKGNEMIMKVFLTIDISHFIQKGEIILDCLNEVIPILRATLSNSELEQSDKDNIIKRIIELIETIVKVSIDSDKDNQSRDDRCIDRVQREFLEDKEDEDDNDSHYNSEDYNHVWKLQSSVIKNLLEFIEGTGIEEEFKKEFFGMTSSNGESNNNHNSNNKLKVFKELYTIHFINLVNPYIKRELYYFITKVFDEDDSNTNDNANNNTNVNENENDNEIEDNKSSHQHVSIKKIFFETIFTLDTLQLAKQKDLTGFYYNMLSVLLTKYIDISLIHIDLKQLCDLNLITSIQNDQQIEGYMKLLHTFLIKIPGLLKYVVEQYDSFEILLKKAILSKCETEPLTKPYPLCSSQRSQYSVYMVMGALCAYSPQLTEKVIKILNDYHHLGFWKSKHYINWRINLSNDRKSHYVGLKNLGCTCYMNCLLQLLFMIPQLRETILAIDPLYPETKYKSAFYQIKNIFASLKAYESQYYNAKDFCANFDGEALDIREQMDAEEFYGRLIDKLENSIKDIDEYKNIFKYFFGGKTVDELIFKDCIHKRENELYYNSIQLQVAGKKNIMESLDSYIQGEMMEGNNAIYCEKCEKKMPALKRQTFRVFPRKLVLVLKRFEFNYDMMVKYKLNNYFEFPMVLNMAPYAQTMQDKEIKYDLTGVIIHVGTCESGHYYSLINDGGKWYEFNDTYVKEFDINELGNEAFGGFEDVYNRDNKKETVEKNMNAYILLYSKQDCDDKEDNFPSNIYQSTITPFSNIPIDIMDRINNDMLQYWVLKIISSNQYQKFIKELLKQAKFLSFNTTSSVSINEKTGTSLNFLCRNNNYGSHKDFTSALPIRTIDTISHNIRPKDKIEEATNEDIIITHEANLFTFGCLFFFNVVLRCKEVYHLAEFTDIVKAYINDDIEHAKWLIEEFNNKDTLKEFIIECPINQSKKICVGIIYCALCKIAQSNTKENQALIISFLNTVLSMTLIPNDMDFIWMIVYRIFTVYNDITITVFDSIDFTNFCWEYYKLTKKKVLNIPQSIESTDTTTNTNTHHLLSDRNSYRIERLTSSEENIEKKNNDRLINNRNDKYLFNTMISLIKESDITTDNLTELLCNIRSKSSAVYFSNALIDFCKTDNAKSKTVLESLLIYIKNNDIGMLEWPLVIARRFLFKDIYHLNDQQADSRILFFFKYLRTIIEKDCFNIYTFIECMTDFLIKCHTKHRERLQIAKNDLHGMTSSIYGFFENNKYPPKYYPNPKVKMYKEDYTCPRNVSTNQLRNFEENFDEKRKDYQNGISSVYRNEVIQRESNYDSDEELTDFKFCVNDQVLYDDYNCRVISVLDEMIQIEYNKDEIEGKKRPRTEWIETDSKTLVIKELVGLKQQGKNKGNGNQMQVDG